MNASNIKKIGTIIIILIIIMMFPIFKFPQIILETFNELHTNWKDNFNSAKKIKYQLKSIKDKIQDLTSKDLSNYYTYIETSYKYDKILLYSLNFNNRVKIDDYWCGIYKILNSDTEWKANNLLKFNKFLKNKNINFLYVQAPCKIEKDSDFFLTKIDDCNSQMDYLLASIDKEVKYLDLRENIKESGKKGKDYLDLFFKTDHHWKPETGLWATSEIIKKLNKDYNFNIDLEIANIENYNTDIKKNVYFGYDGRAVTLANACPEDITMITPKFNTDLIVSILNRKKILSGSFEETLMNYNCLKYTDFYHTNHYSVYGDGDRPLIEIKNNTIHDGSKILIIKDSFADVVAPFLSLGIEECSIIDLREFNGNLKEYIIKFNPDIVIALYTLSDTNSGWVFE